nr:DUF126 domain-containing protein [Sphingomonas chungangi]
MRRFRRRRPLLAGRPGVEVKAELLLAAFPAGPRTAPILQLREPLSFWGGVDPATGRLIDPRSIDHDKDLVGRIALIHELRGSSSASSVLLELIHAGRTPTAIIVAKPDAILAVAAIVGREMGWTVPPILRLDVDDLERLPDGAPATVFEDGMVRLG